MESDHIKNAPSVQYLKRLVEQFGSQRAVARALGNKNFQSPISNAINGVRMPPKDLALALDSHRFQTHGDEKLCSVSAEMKFVRDTKNMYRYDAIDDGADLKDIYIPKATMGAEPAEFIEVEARWSAASGEQSP